MCIVAWNGKERHGKDLSEGEREKKEGNMTYSHQSSRTPWPHRYVPQN